MIIITILLYGCCCYFFFFLMKFINFCRFNFMIMTRPELCSFQGVFQTGFLFIYRSKYILCSNIFFSNGIRRLHFVVVFAIVVEIFEWVMACIWNVCSLNRHRNRLNSAYLIACQCTSLRFSFASFIFHRENVRSCQCILTIGENGFLKKRNIISVLMHTYTKREYCSSVEFFFRARIYV